MKNSNEHLAGKDGSKISQNGYEQTGWGAGGSDGSKQEHQVQEILQPAELVKDLEDQIVNQILDLFASHHAHLKERIEKFPYIRDMHVARYRQEILKLLE